MKNISRCIHLFTDHDNFIAGASELLQNSYKLSGVVRITIFGKCSDDCEYEQNVSFLEQELLNIYGDTAPMVSYVTQPLLYGGAYAAEVEMIDSEVTYKELEGVRYLTMEDEDEKILIVCGVRSSVKESIREQSDALFVKLSKILSLEEFAVSDIVRQWNYIPQIVAVDKNNYQHYQAFNDSRTVFYRKADWVKCGYPAATGIGMDCGAVTVDVVAVKYFDTKSRVLPIDNDLQRAAHVYTQNVLIGAQMDEIEGCSTPKFERAKAVGSLQNGYICYISGTAAIRGEASMESNDAAVQTVMTVENVEHLISDYTCRKFGIELGCKFREINSARTYIKNPKEVDQIKSVVDEKWGDKTSVVYLKADVCRDELLVEIEAIANISY